MTRPCIFWISSSRIVYCAQVLREHSCVGAVILRFAAFVINFKAYAFFGILISWKCYYWETIEVFQGICIFTCGLEDTHQSACPLISHWTREKTPTTVFEFSTPRIVVHFSTNKVFSGCARRRLDSCTFQFWAKLSAVVSSHLHCVRLIEYEICTRIDGL